MLLLDLDNVPKKIKVFGSPFKQTIIEDQICLELNKGFRSLVGGLINLLSSFHVCNELHKSRNCDSVLRQCVF